MLYSIITVVDSKVVHNSISAEEFIDLTATNSTMPCSPLYAFEALSLFGCGFGSHQRDLMEHAVHNPHLYTILYTKGVGLLVAQRTANEVAI